MGEDHEIANRMDQLRSDLERVNAAILENARQAGFYSKRVTDNVRLLNEYRLRLSGLVNEQYKKT